MFTQSTSRMRNSHDTEWNSHLSSLSTPFIQPSCWMSPLLRCCLRMVARWNHSTFTKCCRLTSAVMFILRIIVWGKSQAKWQNPVLAGGNQEITSWWSLSNEKTNPRGPVCVPESVSWVKIWLMHWTQFVLIICTGPFWLKSRYGNIMDLK